MHIRPAHDRWDGILNSWFCQAQIQPNINADKIITKAHRIGISELISAAVKFAVLRSDDGVD